MRKLIRKFIKEQQLNDRVKRLLNANSVFDINFNGLPSLKGEKISIVGKSMEDVYDLCDRLNSWLSNKNIAHKIATSKRVNNSDYEQSKKLVTIYVPDDMDKHKLMLQLEYLLKGYEGWHDIKLPFKGYENYSGAIFFRNDRDEGGNYIPAKDAK
jgi:hypothetical protein